MYFSIDIWGEDAAGQSHDEIFVISCLRSCKVFGTGGGEGGAGGNCDNESKFSIVRIEPIIVKLS